MYTAQAVNPLGEAVCQAEFVVVPGEGGEGSEGGLYIPDKWIRQSLVFIYNHCSKIGPKI